MFAPMFVFLAMFMAVFVVTMRFRLRLLPKPNHQRLYRIDGNRHPARGRRGQTLPDFEVADVNLDQPGRRCTPENRRRQRQQRGRIGNVPERTMEIDVTAPGHLDGPRRAAEGGVDKHRNSRFRKRFGEFRCQLLDGSGFDARQVQSGDLARHMGSRGIVAPQLVAVAENEERGRCV